MRSASTSLAAALEAVGVTDPDLVIATIRRHVERHPDSLGDLFPRQKLVERPMTAAERGGITVPAMNKARQEARRKRVEAVAPIIRKLRRSNPAISYGEIAQFLNTAGLQVRPSQSRTNWCAYDIAQIMRNM